MEDDRAAGGQLWMALNHLVTLDRLIVDHPELFVQEHVLQFICQNLSSPELIHAFMEIFPVSLLDSTVGDPQYSMLASRCAYQDD
jgi:hypothetical protein